MGGNQTFVSPAEALAHISEQAWSEFTKADYTLEQWHAACLIHTHEGAPTSKAECKLPVKTPNGVLNRNGVHAAAAALAGARGGLKGVSDEQRVKAGNALKRYYSQLEEEAPESLSQTMVMVDHRQKPGTPGDILEHHGVKGMKWGVRKEEELVGRTPAGKLKSSGSTPTKKKVKPSDPSKPRSSKTSSLSERDQRRVDKFLKRADVMESRISDLRIQNEKLKRSDSQSDRYTRSVNEQTIRDFGNAKQHALRNAEAVKQGKLTSNQKKAIIGAVAVGGILAVSVGAVAVTRGQQSGALNSYMLRSSQFLRGEKTPFNVNKDLSKAMSASDLLNKVAKPVNPGYSKAGGKMNCRRSTYAYELRRRGFDVHATTSSVGWGQSESGVINALTPGSRNFYQQMSMSRAVVDTGFSSVARGDTRTNPIQKILLDNLKGRKVSMQEMSDAIRNNGGRMPDYLEKVIAQTGKSSSAKVLEELAKQPNGARGEVLFKFPGFGHSMAYEIVDGVPHIFDSQKGTLYNAATKMVESKWDGFTAAEITRLDNVNLDLNFLTRWATNVGG